MNTTLMIVVGLAAALVALAGIGRSLSKMRDKFEKAEVRAEPEPIITPFDDKLRELGVKELYDINRREYLDVFKDKAFTLSDRSFYQFIATSFIWEISHEGFKFWHTIALSK